MTALTAAQPSCRLCGQSGALWITDVLKRPVRENDFKIPESAYKRSIYRCQSCDVFFNQHQYIASDFYTGTYNQAVYGHKLFEKYQQIMALPPEKSDNRARVSRIHEFLQKRGKTPAETRVLDVGTGLCVFLGALKEFGYACYALDPDPAAIAHAIDHVKIRGGFTGTIESLSSDERFDLITFNKVLEHIEMPIPVLKKAIQHLTPEGMIYIELPDGDAAFHRGGAIEREEFYIEHFMAYTQPSMKFLTKSAGLKELFLESIHEPSDKYTLYGFYQPAHS